MFDRNHLLNKSAHFLAILVLAAFTLPATAQNKSKKEDNKIDHFMVTENKTSQPLASILIYSQNRLKQNSI